MAEHDNFVNSCCPLRRGPPLLVSGSDLALANSQSVGLVPHLLQGEACRKLRFMSCKQGWGGTSWRRGCEEGAHGCGEL